jgi:hypothetical protein
VDHENDSTDGYDSNSDVTRDIYFADKVLHHFVVLKQSNHSSKRKKLVESEKFKELDKFY